MQKLSSNRKQTLFFTSDYGVFLFCFFFVVFFLLKKCLYWAIKNQIFNRHSIILSVRTMSQWIVQWLCPTNAKTNWLNPYPGHYFLAKIGNCLSQEEVGGIDGIKTPWKHTRTVLPASKSIIYSFYAGMWPMPRTQKWHSNKVSSTLHIGR